jgi:Alpha/beta hydrolase domain
VGWRRKIAWRPEANHCTSIGEPRCQCAKAVVAYGFEPLATLDVERGAGIDPLGGLDPQVIIATGHSQSASRLATYVNSIHPLARVVDAYALHGTLSNRIRTDLEVPVWKVLSE